VWCFVREPIATHRLARRRGHCVNLVLDAVGSPGDQEPVRNIRQELDEPDEPTLQDRVLGSPALQALTRGLTNRCRPVAGIPIAAWVLISSRLAVGAIDDESRFLLD
jgi:hypothetical protein